MPLYIHEHRLYFTDYTAVYNSSMERKLSHIPQNKLALIFKTVCETVTGLQGTYSTVFYWHMYQTTLVSHHVQFLFASTNVFLITYENSTLLRYPAKCRFCLLPTCRKASDTFKRSKMITFMNTLL